MLNVDIDLRDGTQFHLKGKDAENVANISTDDNFIYFGDIIMVPKDILSNYYKHEVDEKVKS